MCMALALITGCGVNGGRQSGIFEMRAADGANGVSAADMTFPFQWALSNDGTFHQRLPRRVIDEPKDSRETGYNTEPVPAVAGIDINIKEAWPLYDGGSRDVVVALIDTGVDYTHGELQEAILDQPRRDSRKQCG